MIIHLLRLEERLSQTLLANKMGYTLLIDNYDSFTWNIYADIATLGGNPLVRRNDKITIQELEVRRHQLRHNQHWSS